MEHAIAFAETGHLCLGTLHANSSSQALDRIVNFFPDERRKQLLMDLSGNLRSIISQRLVPAEVGKGRRPAIEILINTPTIAERILNGEFHELKAIMEKSRELGMRTFDWSLFGLYNDGHIGYEDALQNADSANRSATTNIGTGWRTSNWRSCAKRSWKRSRCPRHRRAQWVGPAEGTFARGTLQTCRSRARARAVARWHTYEPLCARTGDP
jgi:hypothetical protein